MSHKTFQETFDSNPNISIKALHRQNLVTFDKTFMINHQLTTLFEEANSLPVVKCYSASWDFFIKLHVLFLLPNNPTKAYYSFCSYGRFSGGPTDRTSKMGSCSSLSQAQ